MNTIHHAAIISPEARLGEGIRIGAFAVIKAGVIIGDDCVIEEGCVLGGGPKAYAEPLSIPEGSVIRSHTVIYAGSEFGIRLETGHHVVIREQTRAGVNLRVGNYSDIEGHCTIGDYCRFHGYVHVGKGSRIGHFVWLFSLTTATNDPLPPSHISLPVEVHDGAVACVGATLMPGAVLGKGSYVTAGSVASGVVPPGAVVDGREGRIVNHVSRLLQLGSGVRHPWMHHFSDAYPPEARPRLDALLQEIMENRMTLQTDCGI